MNLSQIECGKFGSGIAKNAGWVRTDFLQISNLPLYQLRHTSLVYPCILDTTFSILSNTVLYYTILYYTIIYYTILYYTILYYTILYYTILYYTIL